MPHSSYATTLQYLHTPAVLPPTRVGRFFSRIGLKFLGGL